MPGPLCRRHLYAAVHLRYEARSDVHLGLYLRVGLPLAESFLNLGHAFPAGFVAGVVGRYQSIFGGKPMCSILSMEPSLASFISITFREVYSMAELRLLRCMRYRSDALSRSLMPMANTASMKLAMRLEPARRSIVRAVSPRLLGVCASTSMEKP